MITRDVGQLQVVPALVHFARFHSCTVAGLTCYTDGATSAIGSSEFFPGFSIDRLGLSRNFNSMMLAPVVWGDVTTTQGGAGGIAAVGLLSAGIMHASASGGTFTAYSTQDWLVDKGLWRQTTSTSTGHANFAPVQRDVGLTTQLGIGGLMSSATSTAGGESVSGGSSSTGFFYYAGPGPVFSLQGAKRYIKCVMRTRFETTGCGTGAYHMSGAAIFGEPDAVDYRLPLAKRVLVTSGCAT